MFIYQINKYLLLHLLQKFVRILEVDNIGGEIVPNIKNAKKAIKVMDKKNKVNNFYKASMKTAIKNVEKAIVAKDKETATANLAIAIKKIDKAASAGIVTPNFVARSKSRLTKKVNAM